MGGKSTKKGAAAGEVAFHTVRWVPNPPEAEDTRREEESAPPRMRARTSHFR